VIRCSGSRSQTPERSWLTRPRRGSIATIATYRHQHAFWPRARAQPRPSLGTTATATNWRSIMTRRCERALPRVQRFRGEPDEDALLEVLPDNADFREAGLDERGFVEARPAAAQCARRSGRRARVRRTPRVARAHQGKESSQALPGDEAARGCLPLLASASWPRRRSPRSRWSRSPADPTQRPIFVRRLRTARSAAAARP
jgi:hypothetical protein